MAGSRREFYLQNLLDAVNGDTATYPDIVAGTREEKYFQNMIDAASGNDLTYPELVPVWSNPEGWYEKLVLALQNGGGGGSNWELIGSKEFDVSTSSTTASVVGSVVFDTEPLSDGDIIWVHIRDKAGKRNNYFYGHDDYAIKIPSLQNGIVARMLLNYKDDAYGGTAGSSSNNGVYVDSIEFDTKTVNIKSKYNSTYSCTINGTYKVDVYKLTVPDGMTMFQ